MAMMKVNCLSLFFLFSLVLHSSIETVDAFEHIAQNDTTARIKKSHKYDAICRDTVYPEICKGMLSDIQLQHDLSPEDYTTMSVSLSFVATRDFRTHLSKLHAEIKPGSTPEKTAGALKDCYDVVRGSTSQTRRSVEEMNKLEPGGPWNVTLASVQTWLSAASTNDRTCFDSLQKIEEGPLKTELIKRVTMIKQFTTVSLMLVRFLKEGTINQQTGKVAGVQSVKDGSVHTMAD